MNLGFKILKPFFFTPVKIGMLRYGGRNFVRDECCNLWPELSGRPLKEQMSEWFTLRS